MKKSLYVAVIIGSVGLSVYTLAGAAQITKSIMLSVQNLSCSSYISLSLQHKNAQLEHFSIDGISSADGQSIPIRSMSIHPDQFVMKLGGDCQSDINMKVTLQVTYPDSLDYLSFFGQLPAGAKGSMSVFQNQDGQGSVSALQGQGARAVFTGSGQINLLVNE